jgi:hypothetical protein
MTYELAYSKAEKFFQTHSRLLETTRTKLVYNRLFTRHAVFFELLEVDYQGKSVLDLASHDGRWSLAALVAGASEVVGIEGREELVRDSEETVRTYGYSAPEISFHAGDILKTLRSMPKRKFDIVLNLGFFYHTIQHVEIVDELSRFEPDVMITDTAISGREGAVIELVVEDTNDPRMSLDYGHARRGKVITGSPSLESIALMMDVNGYDTQFYDWLKHSDNLNELEDYKNGSRITAVSKIQ